ncbi:MAG: 30S ribosomal protein S4 [Nanoarchaeota archaeon]|nr:30S ribosomal protein S4 [Nanoarchaeota archaeon]
MGDPKKLKKKYSTPMHPWNKDNIESERLITAEYALKIKKEIFIVNSFLKKYKNIAKKLIAKKTTQGEKEKAQVLTKMQHLGLLPAGADIEQILGLQLKDVLERRLQSIVYRKGLARTMSQARQFIVHRHIMVKDKEISMPSYLMSVEEENLVSFKEKSSLSNEDHPERVREVKKVEEKVKEEVKKDKENTSITPISKELAEEELTDEELLSTEDVEEPEEVKEE